ncbi:MAG: N-acetyl-gamma-glutamyl-phosphate reductase [Myxococcota bacterium]
MSSLTVGVVGVTGYVGGELVRWLLQHPHLQLASVVGRSAVGRPLADVQPALAGLTSLTVQDFVPAELAKLDVVALATPHGVARHLVPALEAAGARRIVDLSADHRHAEGWVYGQPEWNAEQLAGATRVAVPGCFATAISLAVAPLVAAGVVNGPVQVAAITGSTGSGATPSAGTHHPERFANVKAYKVLQHQHVPEIRGFLASLGTAPTVHFVPASGPFDRGIFATCFVPVAPGIDARAIVVDAYAHHPRIRIRPGSPELRYVRGTGFCDLSVHAEDGMAVVLAAIDNLGRGAAAQAVQCLEHLAGVQTTPISACIP